MEEKNKQEDRNPNADAFMFYNGNYARVVGINAVQTSMAAGVRVMNPEDLLRCCGQVVKILSVNELSDFRFQYEVEFWDRKYYIQGRFLVPSEEKPVTYSHPVFRPFNKVLVRDNKNETWEPGFFGKMKKDGNRMVYAIIGSLLYYECIPYEGNEHLAYTKNNPG